MLDQSSSSGVVAPPPAEGGAQGRSTSSDPATKSLSHSQSSAVTPVLRVLQSTANPFVPTAPSSSSGQTGSFNTAAPPFVPGGAKKVVVGPITSPISIGAAGAANKLQKTAAPFIPTYTPANNNNAPPYPTSNTNNAGNGLKSSAPSFTPGGGGGKSLSAPSAVGGDVIDDDEEELIPDPDKIALTRSNLQAIPFNKIPLHELAAIAALTPPEAPAAAAEPAHIASPNTPKSPRSINTDDGDDEEDQPVKLPQGAYKEEANRINDIVVSCWGRDVNVPSAESPTFNVATSQSAKSTPPTCAVNESDSHHDPYHDPPQYTHSAPLQLGGKTMLPTSVGPQRLNSDDKLLIELKELGGYTLGMEEGTRPHWMCLETFAKGHVIAFATDTDGCLAIMDVLKESVARIWAYIIEVGPTSGRIDVARHFSSSSKTASQRDAPIQAELKAMSAVVPQIEDDQERGIVITQLQAVIQQLVPDLFQFSHSAFSSRVVQFFVDTHFAPFLIPIVQGLRGHCFMMAKSGTGSRILRSLLEFCGGKGGGSSAATVVGHVVGLMSELDTAVTRDSTVYHCVHDHYANHVLQCALMHIPGGIGVFMARRLAERFMEFAVHPYGSRVIQSLFEEVRHPRVSPATEQAALRLMIQAFRNMNSLINNQYGSLVIGHALVNAPHVETPSPPASGEISTNSINYNKSKVYDFSSIPFSCGSTLGDVGRLMPIDRTVVCEFGVSLVFVDITKNARAKYGSVVVQRAIESASIETVQALAEKLLQPTPAPLSKLLTQSPHATHDSIRGLPELAVLVMDGFGNVACQTLFMRLPHQYQTLIISSLKPYMPIILHAKGGKVFIKKIAPELLVLNTLEALHSHMGYTGGVPPKAPDMTVRVGVAAIGGVMPTARRLPNQAHSYEMLANNNNMPKKGTPKSVMHDMPPPSYGSDGMYNNNTTNNNNSPATSAGGGYSPNQGHNLNNITTRSNNNSVPQQNNIIHKNNSPGGGGDNQSGAGDTAAADLALELLKQEHTNRLLQQQLQFQQMLMQQQTIFMNMQPSSANASAGGGFGNLQMMMMQNQQMFNGMGCTNNALGVMGNGLMGGNNNNHNVNNSGPASVVGSGASGSTINNNADNGMGSTNGLLGGNMFSGSGGLMSGFNGMNFNSNNNGMMNMNLRGNSNFNALDIGGSTALPSSAGFNAMGDFSSMNFNNMGLNIASNGGNNSQIPSNINSAGNNNNMFGFGMMNSLPFGNNNLGSQQVWGGIQPPLMPGANERKSPEPLSSNNNNNNNNNNWIQSSPLPQNSSSLTSLPTPPMYTTNNN